MKLNWFSPSPPDHTDIANYLRRILPALSQSFQLSVFTENERFDPSLTTFCPFHSFKASKLNWKLINQSDHNIYNVGNNIAFHGEIIQAARLCPGIVLMHDLAIHETVLNWFLHSGDGRVAYFDTVYRYGGESAVEMAKAFLDEQSICANELSKNLPLHQYALNNATGIITHNSANIEALKNVSNAPILFAPLPYLQKEAFHQPYIRKAKTDSSPYRIIVFGFLGSTNRRLKELFKAFAKFEHKNRFRIYLAGKYDEGLINNLIRDYKIEKFVNKKGFVSDEDLEDLLKKSDLAFNLRWPTRGESSGTVLRTWNASLPTILTKTDFYKTIPEDSALFVDPDNEENDILRHLDAFLKHPDFYFEKGLNGRNTLIKHHSAEAFVQLFKDFLPVVDDYGKSLYQQMAAKNIATKFVANYPLPDQRNKLIKTIAKEFSTWV